MRVYIVWVKSKKVTLKNPLSRMFHEYFMGRPYLRDTYEIFQVGITFYLPIYASHMSFSRVTHEPIAKLHWFFISCSILHQFNTKSNTIKSHKIQWNNLMQLQYFLSWNKANIKYNCKSQLYNLHLWLFRDKTPYNKL